jgi:cation diffusion facilitator CzcD-associated flavoprotein CzcO
VPPSVAIVGAGFGGLGLGIRLKQAGVHDFTIFDRAAEVGGTWRDNTYPGLACDVPSHLYSFSFEPKRDWSRRFPRQPEILEYLRSAVRRHGLGEHLRLGAEVTSARFEDGRWRVRTAGGGEQDFDVLVAATGQLSRPAWPRIPGLDSFKGRAFHSAEWDHSYDVRGKRIAVIGTGASAVQFVPEIARDAAQLHVFQRSAPYVVEKRDKEYPRWERRLFRRLPAVQALDRLYMWMVFETFIAAFTHVPPLRGELRRRFRKQLERQVESPELRAQLTPDYEIGCKRVLISNDWYPALQRPNVELVTAAVTEVVPDGVVTPDGRTREVDAIVCGTGFSTVDFLAPMEVSGLGGRDLNEAWRDGPDAYLGLTISGFPNLFVLYGPNTNLGSGSIVYMLESQIAYVLDAVERLGESGGRWLDVRPEAQARASRAVQRRLTTSVWNTGGCTNWYVHGGRNTNNWPGYMLEYRLRTRRLRPRDYRLATGS